MSAPQKSSLQVNTDLNALTQVLIWLESLDFVQISEPVWVECKLAIAEAFTNAVRHAHKDYPPDTPIRIEITQSSMVLEICIWDQGPPFDLNSQLQPMPSSEAEAEGGWGLPLIHKIADDWSYERTSDGYNCLRIQKQRAETLSQDDQTL